MQKQYRLIPNPDDGEPEHSMDLRLQGGETRRIPFRHLVISAGSWSPRLFSRLFPSVNIGLRLAEKQHVQTWLRFSAPGTVEANSNKKEQEGGSTALEAEACHQVWLSPLDEADDIHVSSFADGELYAAGALERVDNDDTAPPLPDDVRPTRRKSISSETSPPGMCIWSIAN